MTSSYTIFMCFGDSRDDQWVFESQKGPEEGLEPRTGVLVLDCSSSKGC